ncbi:glutamate-5-semialdehyde dehydrogenase [Candidatus Planktophila dulcis]|jgi:glutamate-5-semialdehyde dehydrogenase|uniref:glutamate-5-semialdehyde dehydrogenase n=1 Tax=Candidatus Planktophila dulcis TaxID=1884914 RepID=UPI000BAC644A|nr:glutamate-5-semialdehyde dehydrogenase [Candidatus Planktophila dulcis]ASY21494.1 glutamate-5-semialdehyde dehydrogenase [Candidatus Planktophila dulcis]
MNAEAVVAELAQKARKASRSLSTATGAERKAALEAIAKAIESRSAEILAANVLDMASARAEDMHPQMQDRLLLTAERIAGIAGGARQVAALADPLGQTLRKSTLANGLELEQISVPFGVIGMVYEARPNVTVDAAVILLMSGNAALLRGSSSAHHSNEILVNVMKDALATTKISPDVLQLIPSEDRATTKALLTARGKVDLVIPRGSAALIRMVVDEATVPTIETGAGVCHVYVDEFADIEKALPILINSKTHRPSVCNAAETLLVHKAIAPTFLPMALKALSDAGVILHSDATAQKVADTFKIASTLATDANWSTEYGVLEMNVAVVDSVDAAADHIAQYGTNHTEAIVTENKANAARFIALSDCAAVMVNTSTRFTDGEQMGFGAEIGISNQKLHARGPMGLEAMTTTTWIVTGTGQIRS